MNINNWSGKKKALALFGGLFAIIGLIITIFLVQKVQEIRSRAEKATVLSLTPPNQSVAPGEDAKLDLNINPGTNQVNFVKFTIKFDPDNFNPSLTIFNVNPDSPLKVIEGPSFTTDGKVTYTLGVGSDPTKVVQNAIKLGTILLPAKESASSGQYQIIFDEANTQVRSINANDAFNENVLSSTVPATVTITATCTPNVGTCSWDPVDGATSYRYQIEQFDNDQDNPPSEGFGGTTDKTSVEFPSIPGKIYRCEVVSINDCGEGEPSEKGLSTCPLPSATPTPGPSETPTPVPSEGATPTPTPSATPTPTNGPTSTPTPTTPPGSSPTPTSIAVNSPTPTSTEIAQVVTSTPVPTLPKTGSPFVVGGILGGILVILGGLALLIL